ncbi:MAG: serine/threonine dehydratase [Rhodobacter sp.]|nr:serine/threonine dehydratase [Rhodobacter sp.]
MISRADIEAAHARIAPHIRRTPVQSLEGAALGLPYPVTLKLEHLQATGSFKLRGAFNNLLSADLTPETEVVAISGGNHGAAVALAASRLGVRSTVFVPGAIAVEVKLARIRAFGATVEVVEGSVDDAFTAFEARASDPGTVQAHPYDSELTLQGQGTVAREIAEQAPGIDTLMVSVGGGGLIGGVLSWFQDRVKVVAVETTGTSGLAQSLAAGHSVTISPSGISASGLGAATIGALPMQAINRWLGGSVVVSDEDTKAAQRRLWDGARLIGEPGAATALAALTSGAYVPEKDERVGVLICGGNASPDWFL